MLFVWRTGTSTRPSSQLTLYWDTSNARERLPLLSSSNFCFRNALPVFSINVEFSTFKIFFFLVMNVVRDWWDWLAIRSLLKSIVFDLGSAYSLL